MTPPSHSAVEVTQADRDAAAERLSPELAKGTIAMLQEGRLDRHPWVQAFARHRHQARVEALEEAAGVADEAWNEAARHIESYATNCLKWREQAALADRIRIAIRAILQGEEK